MSHDSLTFLKISAALLLITWGVRRAAGTLGPKLGIGGVVFLVSRSAVMAPMFVFTTAILAFFVFGPRNPTATPPSVGVLLLVSVTCGLGATVLVVGPVFLLWRLRTPQQKLLVRSDEEVAMESQASHFLGGEGRGGTLTVTSKRLAFTPHRFNVQLTPWELPLSEVKALTPHGQHVLVVESARGTDTLSMMKRDALLHAIQTRAAQA